MAKLLAFPSRTATQEFVVPRSIPMISFPAAFSLEVLHNKRFRFNDSRRRGSSRTARDEMQVPMTHLKCLPAEALVSAVPVACNTRSSRQSSFSYKNCPPSIPPEGFAAFNLCYITQTLTKDATFDSASQNSLLAACDLSNLLIAPIRPAITL